MSKRAKSLLDEVRAHHRARFESFAAETSASDPQWLRDLRQRGMERFQALGFPTTRHEEWRYTNVAKIAETALELATSSEPDDVLRAAVDAARLPIDALLAVFVNGRFCEALSDDPATSPFESLSSVRASHPDALEDLLGSTAPDDDAFAALNTAFIDDGALVHARSDESQIVHLLFVSTAPGISYPRVLIHADPNARVTVLQDHVSVGDANGVCDVVNEVVVRANASVELVQLQREGETASLFTSTRANQDRASRFRSHVISIGGALVRNDLGVLLGGEGAECALRGLFIGEGSRHVDNHTLVDHAVAHCESDELYKGVLDDRSRGVFRGRVLVRKDAQKTNARQSNPNLLLSDTAEIDTKPQLEIYADDVKCSHGSAIGRLDPDALFYLRSRGIGEADARTLLMQGFAFEITNALPDGALAEAVRGLIFGDLDATTGLRA